MPHLIIEASRGSLERAMFKVPIELDASGKPADILAPPVPIRRTIPTPLSTVRIQIIVEQVQLQALPGSSQCTLNLIFDQGSIEILSTNQSVGLLGGTISIPFSLGFTAATTKTGSQIAQLAANFSSTVVVFSFDLASKARVIATIGAFLENLAETAISGALTSQFSSLGSQPAGLNLNLTPGIPSESLLTVDAMPGVVWLTSEILALSLQYAPEPVPPPFQPIPFLPGGQPAAFGLRLSNDGFQRTVRNPAVRKLARDMLSDRILDGFVQQVYAERGGTGGPTDADRAEGQKRLDDYLKTPQGLADLANETPAPTGNGRLRKHMTKVPAPFSDFDVEVPQLDLWLGTNRIEGSGKVTGNVNGFGFTADIRFRATPVLITSPSLSIELHDLQLDDPDISIDLPFWLEWALGALIGYIAGPVFSAIVGFLLSSIIASLIEAFIPSNLGSKVPSPDPQPVKGLPPGIDLSQLNVVPDHLQILGGWYVFIDDPRPFWPIVRIVDTVQVKPAGRASRGTAWFTCLGALGIVMDADPQSGTPFTYLLNTWQSTITATLDSAAVPLPLTRMPWTIAIGYRSPEMYHFPVISAPAQTLLPGPLTVTADVWRPEPPMKGKVVSQTFTIDVSQPDQDRFVLSVPATSHCVLIELETKVIDAAGTLWDAIVQIDIVNETVGFGADFDDFAKQCAGHRRNFFRYKVPSLLDKVWNPPDVYQRIIQEGIRTEEPGVTAGIGSMIEAGGKQALQLILAPSLVRGKQV